MMRRLPNVFASTSDSTAKEAAGVKSNPSKSEASLAVHSLAASPSPRTQCSHRSEAVTRSDTASKTPVFLRPRQNAEANLSAALRHSQQFRRNQLVEGDTPRDRRPRRARQPERPLRRPPRLPIALLPPFPARQPAGFPHVSSSVETCTSTFGRIGPEPRQQRHPFEISSIDQRQIGAALR